MSNSALIAFPETHNETVRNVDPQKRSSTLDIVRGLGVLGILTVNILSFSLAGSARGLPNLPSDAQAVNRAIWVSIHVFADGRFMTVFCLLFGAGICLMSERIEGTGLQSGPMHFRRMMFLVVAGLLHAYILWSGDILFAYGICGSVCWLFRRSSPLILFIVGACFLAIGGFALFAIGDDHALFGYPAAVYWGLRDALHISYVSPVQEISIYKGSWVRQMARRIPESLDAEFLSFWVMIFWRICGTILIGMGLLKVGFLAGSLRKMAYWWGLGVAAAAVMVSSFFCATLLNDPSSHSVLLDIVANLLLSIPIGIGWVSIAVLIAGSSHLNFLKEGLQAAGRLAFTNYILQTAVCTTIFYGSGFGLFGSLDRLHLMGIMGLIWIAELAASVLWLRRFSYGPLEWIMRYIVYWRRPYLYDIAGGGRQNTGPLAVAFHYRSGA